MTGLGDQSIGKDMAYSGHSSSHCFNTSRKTACLRLLLLRAQPVAAPKLAR
jgi:hypothetical protein